jgi:predicted metal-dependent phosphoesterase TrpH
MPTKSKFEVDLHLHTTASDGSATPLQVIQEAHHRGIRVLAVADHDTVGGVRDAVEAGTARDIEVVPAIEFSTRDEPEKHFLDQHVLGHYVDVDHPGLAALLTKVQRGRIEQKCEMIRVLRQHGIVVSQEEVFALAAGGVPGRTHIWAVIARNHGYAEADRQPFFDEYLNVGGVAHVERRFELSVEDAIQAVLEVGGVPVLAHPGDVKKHPSADPEAAIRQAMEYGLRGIEVSYPYDKTRSNRGCTDAQLRAIIGRYDRLADELGLLKTGGSDYHAENKETRIGERGMTYEAYQQFKQACERRQKSSPLGEY